jgi:hypothetical protein
MRTLDLADLAMIAGRALELDSDAALELLDLEAADAALAAAREAAAGPAPRPERVAAVLLVEVVRRRPVARGNDPVAMLSAVQLLALNGITISLEPEDTRELLAGVAAGVIGPVEVRAWLGARIRPEEPSGGWEGAIARAAREVRRRRSRRRSDPLGEGGEWDPRPWRGGGLQDQLVRFSPPARGVVVRAQAEARAMGQHHIGTEHLLLGLLAQPEELAARALERLGVGAGAVHAEIERIVGRGPAGAEDRPVPFAPRVKEVLELAVREALRRGEQPVRCEHVLLALLAEGKGLAAEILVILTGDLDRVERTLAALEADEVTHLRAEVARLRALLAQHDIPIPPRPDPPEPGTATAS